MRRNRHSRSKFETDSERISHTCFPLSQRSIGYPVQLNPSNRRTKEVHIKASAQTEAKACACRPSLNALVNRSSQNMGENVAATDGQFTARTKEIGVCTYSRNVFLGADADRAGTLVYTGLSNPTPIFAVRAGLRDKKKVRPPDLAGFFSAVDEIRMSRKNGPGMGVRFVNRRYATNAVANLSSRRDGD